MLCNISNSCVRQVNSMYMLKPCTAENQRHKSAAIILEGVGLAAAIRAIIVLRRHDQTGVSQTLAPHSQCDEITLAAVTVS